MIGLVGWVLVGCVTPKAPSAPEAAAEIQESCFPGVPGVVAKVDGHSITCEELLDYAGPQVIEAQLQAANELHNAIDQMIVERMLEAEADAAGMPVEKLVKSETDGKVSPPTDAEIEALYSENAASMPGTLEEMRPQLIEYLMNERRAPYFRAYVAELEKTKNVQRFTPMFRLPVEAGDSARWGKETAPVQIIEFSDFQCPACQQAAPIIDGLKAKYGDNISVVFRHFPLPFHTEAAKAAQASECANEQGKFWDYHDRLFAEKKAWTDEDFRAIAAAVGLEAEPFATCLVSGRHETTIAVDEAAATRAGVNGTPAFFVNGIPVFGVPPEDVFSELIQRELSQTM